MTASRADDGDRFALAASPRVQPAISRASRTMVMLGAHLGPYCWPAAVKLIEDGKVPVAEICTHQLPLAEFEKAFSLVEDSSGDSVKVSLLPFA